MEFTFHHFLRGLLFQPLSLVDLVFTGGADFGSLLRDPESIAAPLVLLRSLHVSGFGLEKKGDRFLNSLSFFLPTLLQRLSRLFVFGSSRGQGLDELVTL
jgi:hypothetical protein